VFIQGDHFQLVRKNYLSGPDLETNYVKGLITEAIEAEFYNIDIDSSTLVDLDRPTIKEQQRPNFEKTAELAEHVRQLQPSGIDVSIGGEIGEIGTKNSSPEELTAYLDGFKETFKGGKGLSKLSVQTGTSHGGVVLPDGTLAKVKIDFDTLRVMSDMARKNYGLSGAVQHGASTLPRTLFICSLRPAPQRCILRQVFRTSFLTAPICLPVSKMRSMRISKRNLQRNTKEVQTEEQFIYSTRKKGFGAIKNKWWTSAQISEGLSWLNWSRSSASSLTN